MQELVGKVALVTGASAPRGIGRAICKTLAHAGATVIATDIDGSVEIAGQNYQRSDLLAELVDEIESADGACQAMSLDVTDETAINTLIKRVSSELGNIDILVNNAGSLSGSDQFLATSPQQWETSFRVNLLGPMMLCQAVIPGMQANGGGRIINIGSTGSLGAEAGFGAYTAMKHGLTGLSKTLAAEFGPDGILCNTICPGYIRTDMHMAANARLAGETNRPLQEVQQDRYSSVALRRAGSPEDVAEAVLYLAGPRGAYVTGINLPVAGGVPFGI